MSANDETSIRSVLPGTFQNSTPITNARALSDFRRCYTSEHAFGTAARCSKRTRLSRHIGCLLRSDWYLLLMKSRRRREKKRERESERKKQSRSVSWLVWSGPDGQVSRCSTTTTPAVLLRGERLVNNTKRPRQTNIDFGFTGDTRAFVGLLPLGKLLHRASTRRCSPLEGSSDVAGAAR